MKSLLVMIESTYPGMSSTDRDDCRDEQRTRRSVTNRNSNLDAMIERQSAASCARSSACRDECPGAPDRRIHYVELRDERGGE
jgi:hypothetical protein